MAVRQIYFADIPRGELRWKTHFAGRPGCTRTRVDRDTELSETSAPGVYIEMPLALADAWDAALRRVKEIPRSVPANEANTLARRLIEDALDAILPRKE